MSNPLPRRIRFKCRYEGDIRTVTVTPDALFPELKRRLSSDYGFDVSMKYEDQDGDVIIIASQNDLDDIFMYGESDTINVFISETLSLPNLQLKGSTSSGRLSNAPSVPGSSGNLASLYSTSNVNNSTLNSNMNTINSTRDWSRSNTSDFSSSIGGTMKSQTLLRPINGTRLDRFPNISENSYQNRNQEIYNIRWKKGEMLGQGAFGVVYLGLNIDSGELMAVKQMATEDVSKRELSSLENEIQLLRNLRHPNIVRYIGTELNPESMSIFLEYVPGGSLKALIDKFGSLEESVARSYTRQLLIGLEYLHRHGIAHRDIKGANCLVGNDGVIKLADFGNSKHWRPPSATATGGASTGAGTNSNKTGTQSSSGDIKGTPSWMAPEVIRDEGGSISWRKADLWSLGCTALEMTTGKAPWSQFNNPVTILYHIACQDTLPEYPTPASFELITFLNTCLQRDPKLRPDVTSLLLHPFVSHIAAPAGMSANTGSNWAGGGAAPGAQFMNRPTTVSHSVVGEWDRTHQPAAPFYSSTSSQVSSQDTAAMLTASVGTAGGRQRMAMREGGTGSTELGADISQLTPALSTMPATPAADMLALAQKCMVQTARAGGRGTTPVRDDNPELSLEVDQRHAVVAVNSPNEVLLLAHPSSGDAFFAPDNTASAAVGSPGGSSSRQTQPSKLAAIHYSASPSTVRSPKVKALKQGPSSGHTTASGSNSAVKARRGRKKADASRERETDSPVHMGSAVGSMEAQLAQLLQVPSGEKAVVTARSATEVAGELPNEDDIITPPTTLTVPRLDMHNVAAHAMRTSSGNPANLFQRSFLLPAEDDPYLKTSLDYSGSNYPSSRSTRSVNQPLIQTDSTFSHRKHGRKKQHRRGQVHSGGFESFDSEDNSSWYVGAQPPDRLKYHTDIDGDDDTLNSTEHGVGGYSSTEGGAEESLSARLLGDSAGISCTGLESPIKPKSDEGNKFACIIGSQDFPSKPTTAAESGSSAAGGGGKGVMKPKPQVITGPGAWKRIGTSHSQSELGTREAQTLSKGTNLIRPSTLQTTSSGWRRQCTSTAGSTEADMQDGHFVYNTFTKTATYAPLPDPLDDYASMGEEVAEDPTVVLHEDNNSPYGGAGAQLRQSTARPLRSAVQKTSTKHRDRERESVQFDPEAADMSTGMSVSGMNIDTMRTSTAVSSQLNTPAATTSSHMRTTTAMRSSSSRKSLDASGNMSRHGSRQPLRTANRMHREREKEKEMLQDTDLLDMSCDSLDRLQVTGTAAATKIGDREGTAKMPGSTRSSKRSASATQSNAHRRADDSDVYGPGTASNLSTSIDDAEAEPDTENMLAYPPDSLEEHTAAITRLRAPERTNLLLSSSLDGTIRIWGSEASREGSSRAVLEASSFKTDNSSATNSDVRPERRIALGAGDDSSVTGNSRGPAVKITNMWVDEGCETIWGACSDAALRVWSGGEGRPLRLLKGHEDLITAMEGMDTGSSSASHVLQSSSNGHPSTCLVATGSADRTVRVWDVRAKKAQVFSFRGHGDTVLVLRWGEGGRSLISGGKDKSVRIWDTRAGRLRVTLEKHFGSVSCVRVLSSSLQSGGAGTMGATGGYAGSKLDGEAASIISAGRDSMVNVWSASGDCLSSQAAHRGSVTFLSDINYPGGGSSYIHAYSAAHGLNNKASYHNPAFTHPTMVSLGSDGAIKVWDVRRFKCISEISPTTSSSSQNGNSTKAVWCSQGLITGSNTGAVRLYEHSAGLDAPGTARDPTALIGGYETAGGETSYLRSGSGSPGALQHGAYLGTTTATSSQDWMVRDLAMHHTVSTSATSSHPVGSHSTTPTQLGNACTDLICSEALVASGSKSGQILRWSK